MKIFLTGYTGFLGSFIFEKLSPKYKITKINLRNINFNNSHELKGLLEKFDKADVIINCAASLKPNNSNDFFLNEELPEKLSSSFKSKNKKVIFIHMSSINVLIKDREDIYTKTKRLAEKNLENSKIIILRLPLLYKKDNDLIQNYGNLKIFFKYLFLNLPIYPMIYPGHSFEPLNVNKLINFIEVIMLNENKNIKFYNLSGGTKINLWNIFNKIAIQKKKRVFKLKLSFLIPGFLKKTLINKNNFLQQLIDIDNTKFSEDKTILK